MLHVLVFITIGQKSLWPFSALGPIWLVFLLVLANNNNKTKGAQDKIHTRAS